MKQTDFLILLLSALAGPFSVLAVPQNHGNQGHAPGQQAPTTAASVAPTAPGPTSANAPTSANDPTNAPQTQSATGTTPSSTASTGSTDTTDTTSSSSSSGSGPWGIKFSTSGSTTWYWTATGGGGTWTGSGTGGAFTKNFQGGSTGGAMFIGTTPNPGAGNTKLECFFPSGSGSPNCDISLVDGYSVSVQCTIPGAATIGLGPGTNLFNLGTCPEAVTDGFCKNTEGYSASINDVDKFFTPAKSTCYIWQLDGLDPDFTGPATIDCTVSGGYTGSTNAKRDEEAAAAALLERGVTESLEPEAAALVEKDVMESPEPGMARRHAHRRRGHTRGLMELLGGAKL